MDYAPGASFNLLRKAYQNALSTDQRVFIGSVFSGDIFYLDDPDWWRIWADYGTLAVDMETSGLYTLAAKFNAEALAIMTISDSLVTGEEDSAKQREQGYLEMVRIALEILP
jgi:purine-nucleoside phosphorylase